MRPTSLPPPSVAGTAQGLRVAIMTDERGWHTTRLKRALRARGCEGHCVDLADCRIDTTWAWHGLAIPGYGRGLPDAVIVRGVAGGSFEQVTLRLGILHALRELGVPVYNDARAIERSVDKGMTSFLLHLAGIPTPATWVSESVPQARRTVMRESAAGRALVLKPLFGSQGKGLQRIGALATGHAPLPALSPYRHVAYLQRFVPAPAASDGASDGASARPGFDWRVLVVGGQAVAAMRRVSDHWVHNVAQGAQCEHAEISPALAALAIRATEALGLDYAGVDLVPAAGARAGEAGALVIEVNGVAAWRGLQSVTEGDIAGLLVDDLLGRKLPAARACAKRAGALA
ncbi:ATP-grasp domain-containing protein [Cupriavidus oxalaticus]|uniref:ATP-grasp domain-containing protein n=1 Tax=Cupriavidus TaxID=106589 RepID=UPI00197A8A60|nr:RimK family alpha-L-glutamate ligase [Cupriavidus oxalaticus]